MNRALAFAYLASVALQPAYVQNVQRPVGDRGASGILVPGKGWELLGEGYQLTADSAVDKQGNIFFTDAQKDRIMKIDLEGKISLWKDGSHGSHGIAQGPDGRLYAGQHDLKRIVAYSADGGESVIAEGVQTHHLTVTARKDIYFTEAPAHKVWLLDAKGNSRVVHEGINWPRGVRASGDQKRLVVNDAKSAWIWSFEIQPDGSLVNGRETYRLESLVGSTEADPGGMTFDSEGFLYVATKFGVQVFDRQAHLTAIIGVPSSDGVSNVLYAGPGFKWLYAMEWNKVYRRPVRRRGAEPFASPPRQ